MKQSEWFTLLAFGGFLVFLASYSQVASYKEKKRFALVKEAAYQPIQIELRGAVLKPGTYKCLPGSNLRAVLAKTNLLKGANRRKIPFQKILLSDQIIEIPFKVEAPKGRKTLMKKNRLEQK